MFAVVGVAGKIMLVYLNVVLVVVDAAESHHLFLVMIVFCWRLCLKLLAPQAILFML